MKLSQKAKIMGVKHSGATARLGSDGYTSRNAQEILEFNCRVFNHRFNNRRSYKVSQSFLHGSDLKTGKKTRHSLRMHWIYSSKPYKEWSKSEKEEMKMHWTKSGKMKWSDLAAPLGGLELSGKKPQGDTDYVNSNPWTRGTLNQVANQTGQIENRDWSSALKRIKTTGEGSAPTFRNSRKSDKMFYTVVAATDLHRSGRKTWTLSLKGGGRNKKDKYKIKLRLRSSQLIREDYTSVQINISTGWVTFRGSNVQEVVLPKTGKSVGIDRGVVKTAALSDGNVFNIPKPSKVEDYRLRKLQREGSYLVKGSHNYQKNLDKQNIIKRKQANRRESFNHKLTKHLVLCYDKVVLEKLNTSKMMKSARGTIAEPGTNVNAKRGLSRVIAGCNWGQFEQFLSYKSELYGRELGFVDPKNTSRECSECGYTDKKNRENQASFLCKQCGHTMNADLNAAINILNRG